MPNRLFNFIKGRWTEEMYEEMEEEELPESIIDEWDDRTELLDIEDPNIIHLKK
ncbi:hypothetical protein [Heyndrickxia vini]|uniref:Uncharacterized protein n=1 Tax=Heyndrickxia vini TaxID=1476025 RepID=A0ABX7DXE6_9BACI|nr:hypothetical protein [Heyndrickxia vini]QQZ08163.1 hypothetical protein I5776_13875 [Heyndrickxia vini]